MAKGENVIEFETMKNENYTYVSSQTLKLEFPRAELQYEVRQRPSGSLRRRSPEEMERLQEHPFFQEVDQR